MNWFKENPVIAAIAAVALIGTITTTFLAMEGATAREEAVTNLSIQASTLRRYQSMQPYPNPNNFQSLNDSISEYEKAIQTFVQKLNESTSGATINEKITPQIFQDNLRQAVNDLQNEAKKNHVGLPENFFLGFNDYQTQLPSQDEVKKLNREFLIIKNLIEAIIPLGIRSIDSLTRLPAPSADPKAASPKTEASPTQPIQFDYFTLGITAPQTSLIKAFDKIPNMKGFLVVRSMTIQNTNPEPPPKTVPGGQTAKPGSSAPNPNATYPDKLPMIFGSESLKVTILFEAPDFPEQISLSATQTPPKN